MAQVLMALRKISKNTCALKSVSKQNCFLKLDF